MTAKPLLMGALGVVLTLGACGPSKQPPAPTPQAPAAGRLTLRLQSVADMKPVPATLTTRDMAEARARIAGVLISLKVKAGDTVRQGQVIGSVKDAQIGFQTSAYDAQISAAAGQAAAAQADLARTQDLYAHGVYAKARLDQVEAQAKAASGALAAARAQRSASASLGAQGAILAPASGTVLTAETPAGSVVMPGQSVATITAGPPVIRLRIPQDEAGSLKLGEVVKLSAADLRGAAATGTVTQLYPAVTDGEAQADVSAPGLPRDLVGRKVRAWISLGQRQALIVPKTYIVTRFGVDYARLVRADGGADDTPVQTTPGPSADTVEVLSGLRPGDVLTPPVQP
jgi:RND family efflux transporter MFP subunit